MLNIQQEMMDWLVSIVNELADQDKLHKCKKVSSAVCLLVAYAKLSQKSYVPAINEELAMSLLKMIALSPSGEEYEYLKTLMKSDISK